MSKIPPHILAILEACVDEVLEAMDEHGGRADAMIEANGAIDSGAEKLRDALANWAFEVYGS
jgi:hypothetical protein